MARRKRDREGQVGEVEVDMTPMIDVVFQLIIFFMIVMDMSSKDLADLTLPVSETQKEDKKPPQDRIVVNVDKDGDVLIKGDRYSDESLQAYFDQKYAWAKQNNRMDPSIPKICDLTVMIRGHATIDFSEVQKVMQFAGLRKFWKVELGARSMKAQ